MIELTIPNELAGSLGCEANPVTQLYPSSQWSESTFVGGSNSGANTDSTQAAIELQRELNERALPAIDQLAGHFPAQAQELRDCLARMASMMQLAMQQQAELLENLNRNLSCSATSLGDFNIIREVGRGGMGVVYEAEQLSLGRRVALKVLPYTHGLNPLRLQRFRNESQAAASLNHPNIVPVYAVGNRHGVHYYAMQLIDGRSGAQVIADLVHRRLNHDWTMFDAGEAAHGQVNDATDWRAFVGSIAKMFQQLATALDHAHHRGVIHRDIKPANLMLDCAGNVWLTDFGLAQASAAAPLNQASDVIGTLRYICPELLEGNSQFADQQTDIYALGATFYEFLALKPMVSGFTYDDIVDQIKHGDAFSDEALSFVPPDLLAIIKKAVSKSPRDRFLTAREMADALDRFLAG